MKYDVIVKLSDDSILSFDNVEATTKIKAFSKVINDNDLSEITGIQIKEAK